MKPMATEQRYYRHEGVDGRVHITDSLDSLPEEARVSARPVRLEPSPVATPGVEAARDVDASAPDVARDIDATSFLLGFGAALGLAGLLFFLGKNAGWLLKVVAGVALASLLAAAYLGLLRQSTGHDGAAFATPEALVDDARRAVRAVEERRLEQERVIDQVERETKR